LADSTISKIWVWVLGCYFDFELIYPSVWLGFRVFYRDPPQMVNPLKKLQLQMAYQLK
jgi:hypothetical protein